MGPDVALVVVTYNSAQTIEGLLDSLPAALDGLAAEIVVVDNGSQDQTTSIVEEREDCLLVRSSNLGYAAGINAGVVACSAPVVVVLNADVRMGAGSIAALAAAWMLP